MFDAKQVKDGCVQWIRAFFAENGADCNAIVGISGGKDSSVVAALCVEALGVDRVIGVLMPCGVQNDIDAAELLVDHLGIRHYIINIKDAVEGLKQSLPFEPSRQSRATHVLRPMAFPVRGIPQQLPALSLFPIVFLYQYRADSPQNLRKPRGH